MIPGMTLPLGPSSRVAAPAGAAGVPGPGEATAGLPGAAAPVRAAATADVIPASPPRDVVAEVAAAHRRAEELAAANRELHFTRDPGSPRIVVEVRDLEGNVLRTIPPSKALAVMAGEQEL